MVNISLTLYTKGLFGSFLKSPTQMGSLSINNSVTNISRLGTFNVQLLLLLEPERRTGSTCETPWDGDIYCTLSEKERGASDLFLKVSVPDPHVFEPPGSGSGSTSQRYGSGSFNHQAKIVRKTLIYTVLWLFLDFRSYKNDVNVPSKSNKQKKMFRIVFCWLLEGQWRKEQDPDLDSFIRGMDRRIRIHTKCHKINK